ncbi:MAG TPA: hypothetical protein VK501_10840 [Baekduia sp.]|uniref:hypothetical protein n=1 Tax=Baekduia sp. TaxID=2600305 RepID=UPI002BCFF364|nr:hypothetical protein [Baekduia sp.]HMJ34402.1 hypothetical protein [Baekduia sp.]
MSNPAVSGRHQPGGRRARGFALVLLAAVLVLADGWSRAHADGTADIEIHEPSVLVGSALAELSAGSEAARRKLAVAEAAYLRPEAVERRRATADDFAGLADDAALRVFAEHEASALGTPGWVDDEQVEERMPGVASMTVAGTHIAQLVNDDGSRGAMVSTIPLGFESADGDVEPIDLSLRSAADGRAEVADSPVETTLPDSSGDAIVVGGGDARLSLRSRGTDDVDGQRAETGVFYANVDDDTDLFVKPVVGGVETFTMLRSPDSPEELTTTVRGGEGASHLVAQGGSGGALIQNDENATVGTLSPAAAWDAEHHPVAVEAEINGLDVTYRIAHRGKDYAYPITVDPTAVDACWQWVIAGVGCQVDDWENSAGNVYGSGIANWAFEGPADGTYAPYAGSAYLGTGLYVRNMLHNYYSHNVIGDWYYTTPWGTRIYGVQFFNMSQDNLADNTTCLQAGIVETNLQLGAHTNYWCAQQTLDAWGWSCSAPDCSGYAGTEQNKVFFGAQAQRTGWSDYWFDHMGGVAMNISERNSPDFIPNIRSTNFPTDWQTDPNRRIEFNAGDQGLGLKRIQVWSPENPGWHPQLSNPNDQNNYDATNFLFNCTGGIRLPCPKDYWFSIALAGLRTGYSTVNVAVSDVNGRSRNFSQVVGYGTYKTSWDYGGANGAVDTAGEAAALDAAMTATDATGRLVLWNALTPADQGRNPKLTPAIYEDPIVTDAEGGNPIAIASDSSPSSDFRGWCQDHVSGFGTGSGKRHRITVWDANIGLKSFVIGVDRAFVFDCSDNHSRVYFNTYQDTRSFPDLIDGSASVLYQLWYTRFNGQDKAVAPFANLQNGYLTRCCKAAKDLPMGEMWPLAGGSAAGRMKEARIELGPDPQVQTYFKPRTYRVAVSY